MLPLCWEEEDGEGGTHRECNRNSRVWMLRLPTTKLSCCCFHLRVWNFTPLCRTSQDSTLLLICSALQLTRDRCEMAPWHLPCRRFLFERTRKSAGADIPSCHISLDAASGWYHAFYLHQSEKQRRLIIHCVCQKAKQNAQCECYHDDLCMRNHSHYLLICLPTKATFLFLKCPLRDSQS